VSRHGEKGEVEEENCAKFLEFTILAFYNNTTVEDQRRIQREISKGSESRQLHSTALRCKREYIHTRPCHLKIEQSTFYTSKFSSHHISVL
jgi:hypothetical protein